MKRLVFISCIISIFLLGLFLMPHLMYADQIEDVQKQINDTNAQIQALDKQIEQLEGQITTTTQEKNTLANLIKQLTLTRTKLIKEREQTQKKIIATGLVINALNSDINTKQKLIDKSKDSITKMINDLYKSDQISFPERVLSKENFADVSREYNNIISTNEKINKLIEDLSSQQKALAVSKNKKETDQAILNTLKKTLIQKENAITATKKQKDSLLVETKNKEANYQKLLAEIEKRKIAFEKSLEDYESQLKFILNPKLIPKPGSGVLSFPVESVFITSLYGPRWGRFHYGLDFRAKVGTPIKAMANGVVIGTGDTDIDCKGASFGKWVFIKHNNGLSSTYAHLSSIVARTGDKVSSSDIIAYSGNTGSSTGPHLHVAVYASDGVKVDTVPSKSCNSKIFMQPIAALTAYLDPILYLPKVSNKLVKE